MASRFYPQKDIDTFDKFNKELVGDLSSGKDGIIYQPVVAYKISAVDTETNMYGETSQGKVEIGDIIEWNTGYWEISSISENQLVGGQTDYNHSVVCNSYLQRISTLNIERVRSI